MDREQSQHRRASSTRSPRFLARRRGAGLDTGVVGDRADFLVSHAGADRAWAEWVAWQLAGAGYTVELDLWD